MTGSTLSLDDFVSHYQSDAKQIMWLLGAGASRAANLPTATDLIWDLKKRYYCASQDRPYDNYDLDSEAVKGKIQEFMDTQGFPALWSANEYSFYFELMFGDDYQRQQRYLESALNPERISLNVGNRIFAALISLRIIRVAFTTNFDSVVELAYSKVTGENLHSYNIEGAYAALDALNNEAFPIYAKLHGDFRYQSIKNLSVDLLENDTELKKCFLAAASRFGLVVSGYSGRDLNVMTMLEQALDVPNAFPKGIYWTVPNINHVEESASIFIQKAREKGISAYIVETGTFDEFLSKLWRQTLNKPEDLVDAVKLSTHKKVSIKLPSSGSKYPILRTNMLPITNLNMVCGELCFNQGITFSDLRENAKTLDYRVSFTYTDRMLFWGNEIDAVKVIPNYRQLEIRSSSKKITFSDIKSDSFLKGFVEEGIVDAICQSNLGVRLRKSGKSFYFVINEDYCDTESFNQLKRAVGYNQAKPIAGSLNKGKVTWSECVEVGLEVNGEGLFLYLRPDIWIKPLKERSQFSDFLKDKKRNRYNSASYHILDAWIGILFGGTRGSFVMKNTRVMDFAPQFEVITRTAYSRRG